MPAVALLTASCVSGIAHEEFSVQAIRLSLRTKKLMVKSDLPDRLIGELIEPPDFRRTKAMSKHPPHADGAPICVLSGFISNRSIHKVIHPSAAERAACFHDRLVRRTRCAHMRPFPRRRDEPKLSAQHVRRCIGSIASPRGDAGFQ